MNEQQADFGHIWKGGTHKTQAPPACTQPIQCMVRLWVRDSEGMVWWWGEGKNLFLRLRLRLFWGKCPARMTYYPKETS